MGGSWQDKETANLQFVLLSGLQPREKREHLRGWSGPKHLVSAHTKTTGQGPLDIQPGLPEVPMNLVFHSTNVAGAQSPLGLPRGAEELSWSLPSSAALGEGLLCSCCAAAALLMRKGIARSSKSFLSSLIPHCGHWSS